MTADTTASLASILSDDGMLYLTPRTGAFDVARVAAQILALGHPLKFPFPRAAGMGDLYMVFRSAADREATRDALAANPSSHLPHVLLIDVKAGEVSINGFCGDVYAPYVRTFLRGLMQDTPFDARWPGRDAAYVNPRVAQFCGG